MDLLDDDLLVLWKELNRCEVKYIMVGGFAAVLHGASRITEDVDIWIKDTKENRVALRKSLSSLGVGDFQEIETIEFIPGWTSIYFDGIELDIFTSLKAFPQSDFEECFKISPVADIDGVNIRFLHINLLIHEKKITARPKDLFDIEELERIKKLSGDS